MQKIYKSVIRDIWYHRMRSMITVLSILIVIAFPIAMFSTAPSLDQSIQDDEEFFRLAHLDVRFQSVTDEIIPVFNKSIYNFSNQYPSSIQARIIGNQQLTYQNDSYQASFIGLNPNNSLEINKLELIKGKLPESENEICLLESLANEMDIQMHDDLNLSYNNQNYSLEIVGLVHSIEYLSYNLQHLGAIYFYEPTLRDIIQLPLPFFNSIAIYFWESISNQEISDISDILRDQAEENHLSLILLWQIRNISVSAVFQDAIDLTSKYLSVSAYIIMLIAGLVIYIINKRYAIEQRKRIGTLYAFGISSTSIYRSFLFRTLILSIIGIGIGIGTGFYFLKFLTQFLGNRWGVLQIQYFFVPNRLILVCCSTFIISHLFTYLAVRQNVKMTPYEALRGKPSEFGQNISSKIILKLPSNFKYPLRNLIRNKQRSLLTIFAFFGAILLSFSLIVAQYSVYTTIDQYYEEQIQWDLKTSLSSNIYSEKNLDFLENHPDIKDYEPYLETFVQPVDNPEMLIILRGIQNNSKLLQIDLQEGRLPNSETASEIILSKYIAERLEINLYSNISVWLGTTELNLTIVGFSRDMDETASLFIYLSSIEELLGTPLINGVLISLKIDEKAELIEYLNSKELFESSLEKQTAKNRMHQLISNQTIIVNVMVILGFIISFITIFTTAFITAIERQRELSLQSVFGFSNWFLLRQLFLEIMFLIIFALILGLLLGRFLTEYWISIISKFFFKIDMYNDIQNYFITGSLSFMAAACSIYPGFKLMRNQNLAMAIREE